MPPQWEIVVLIGVLGALIGSFLNVCIHRLPRGRIHRARAARCPACTTPIHPSRTSRSSRFSPGCEDDAVRAVSDRDPLPRVGRSMWQGTY
jgi:hypothetical protein